MIVDGVYVSGDEAMEQLKCVVKHYPLWPGDTLSHKLAKACEQAGWIVRDADGNWIPTKKGLIAVYVSGNAPKGYARDFLFKEPEA